ncbi:hypothetical protein [Spirochaeta lutea]|nr:hypothetical protein [Spirochaeta lutea]
MAWYWWVLIALGVVFLGYLKLKVLGSIMNKRKTQEEEPEDE